MSFRLTFSGGSRSSSSNVVVCRKRKESDEDESVSSKHNRVECRGCGKELLGSSLCAECKKNNSTKSAERMKEQQKKRKLEMEEIIRLHAKVQNQTHTAKKGKQSQLPAASDLNQMQLYDDTESDKENTDVHNIPVEHRAMKRMKTNHLKNVQKLLEEELKEKEVALALVKPRNSMTGLRLRQVPNAAAAAAADANELVRKKESTLNGLKRKLEELENESVQLRKKVSEWEKDKHEIEM